MKTIACTAKPADETAPSKEDKKEDRKKAEKEMDDEDADDEQVDDAELEEGEVKEKAGKKKTVKAPRKGVTKKAKGERKRGPARPYKKLPQDTLDSRIKKLQKRIERTSAQAEEGRNFLIKYTREQSFRDSEAAPEAG